MKIIKPKQVYISHTQGDEDIAIAVSNELRKHDINVWDDSLLSPGSDWASVVKGALKSSDAIIAILSKHSYSSSWVRAELEHALFNEQYKGKFFPVLISKDQNDLSKLPWVLSRIKHLRLSPDEPINLIAVKIVNKFLKYLSGAR
ncbi:MAG: toll/interleukin-1 receptor domain-containing protein [Deltaproteobacteria bacterium]|nr:toll/interleukin-1 receptor domain-containing protein [Deltaproteobacteria bacterium]